MQPDLPMQQSPNATRPTGSWWRVLLTSLFLFLLGVLALSVTGNANLFPTVAMLGNFMVPVAYVSFFYERRHMSNLRMPTTVIAFVYGGALGVIAASLLEPVLIGQFDFLTAFQVGLIEEFAKILGVLVVAWRRRHDAEVDGIILGAAAGMGFAALESNGYTFTAFVHTRGSLSLIVFITLLRGLLSPIGHGTWTAILAGVLFRESQNGKFRINRAVIATYLVVSILHGLWDGLPVAIGALGLSGSEQLIPEAAVGAVGLIILARIWQQAILRQELLEGQQALVEAPPEDA